VTRSLTFAGETPALIREPVFATNAVRLQLHAAYNLGNFLRTPATPEPVKDVKHSIVLRSIKSKGEVRLVATKSARVEDLALPRPIESPI